MQEHLERHGLDLESVVTRDAERPQKLTPPNLEGLDAPGQALRDRVLCGGKANQGG